jgi:hypothetical protein
MATKAVFAAAAALAVAIALMLPVPHGRVGAEETSSIPTIDLGRG